MNSILTGILVVNWLPPQVCETDFALHHKLANYMQRQLQLEPQCRKHGMTSNNPLTLPDLQFKMYGIEPTVNVTELDKL